MGKNFNLTQMYNTRVISEDRPSLKEKLSKLLDVDYTSRVEEFHESEPNWYVASHNKPKATDRNKVNYNNTMGKAYRYRRIRSSNPDYDIFIEPEKDNWKQSAIEKEQQKLYNKLKREYLKELSEDIKEVNKRVRECESVAIKNFDRKNFKQAFAFHQHENIVRLACG